MAAKLKDIRQQLRRRMHEAIRNTVEWLKSVVRGYFQYHAVPGNEQRMKVFRKDVLRMWLHQLRRRSHTLMIALTPRFKVGTVCASCASTGLCGGVG